MSEPARRIVVITCAVLESEVAELAKALPQVIHIELLPQGLHNTPPELRTRLQEAIDRVESVHAPDAIVLGYGLCSRGVEGIRARSAAVVLARAHDCITLLLGCKDRYAKYVGEHPGTYWYSPGWNRHHVPPGKRRYDLLRQKYVEQYGEDNADFLMESEQTWFKSYDRAAYVDLNGIAATKEDIQYTSECADWLGWKFDHQHGDPRLLRDLMAGSWDDARFLVIPPGKSVAMTADERIVEVVD